jgi:hypothetical protein
MASNGGCPNLSVSDAKRKIAAWRYHTSRAASPETIARGEQLGRLILAIL